MLDHYLDNCLYFTANSLCRTMTRMAEEVFAPVGLSPSHVFVLMVAAENPGLSQKELTQALRLAPSTVTRFVDFLVLKGLVERKSEGKAARVFPTEQGEALRGDIAACWKKLHARYLEALGPEGDELARRVGAACRKLEGR